MPGQAVKPINPPPDWNALEADLLSLPSLESLCQQLTIHLTRICQADGIWFDFYDLPRYINFESCIPEGFLIDHHKLLKSQTPAEPIINTGAQSTQYLFPLFFANSKLGLMAFSTRQPLTDISITQVINLSHIASRCIFITIQKSTQHQREKQLGLVSQVSKQMAQFTSLRALTREAVRMIRSTFNYYYVALFTVEESTNTLAFCASASARKAKKPAFESGKDFIIHVGEYIVGTVAKTRTHLLANDVRTEPRFGYVDSLSETRAEVAFPLIVKDRVIGVLDVQSDQINAFDQTDLMVLQSLADHIAISMNMVRLYQTSENKAGQLTLVAEVSRAITNILDLDKLFQSITDLIFEKFSYPFVHIYVFEPATQRIRFETGSGERADAFKTANIHYALHDESGIIPNAARQAKAMLINDVALEPLYRPIPIGVDITGSELALPLVYGGNLLGLLDLQSDKKNAFTAEDQQICQTLADHIAIAMRNAKLYKSERWRRKAAENLRDVAELLSKELSLDEIISTILTKIMDNLPSDAGGFWLMDSSLVTEANPHGLYLSSIHFSDADNYALASQVEFTANNWLQTVINENQPCIRQPDDALEPVAQVLMLPTDYSAIAIPLRTESSVLGILFLVNRLPQKYGQESINIITAYASYSAIAMENARLVISSQEQAWISTVLLQVAEATHSITSQAELISTVIRLIPLLAGVEGCALLRKNLQGDAFTVMDLHGLPVREGILAPQQVFPVKDTPLLLEMMNDLKIQTCIDPISALNLPLEAQNYFSQQQVALIPLIIHTELIGAFLITNNMSTLQANKPMQEQTLILQGIAQQTAVALENIQLLEERKTEAYMSNVLLQVAQTIVSISDLDKMLESIVNLIPFLVGIESCLLFMWDEAHEHFWLSNIHAETKLDHDELAQIHIARGEYPLLDAIWESNQALIHPVDHILPPEDWDVIIPNEIEIDSQLLFNSQYPLILGFPLSIQEKRFGILLALETQINPYRARRFELLNGIARQVSMAIQNDMLNKEMVDRERLEREFQLAREIQQTFLPNQLIEPDGWAVDVRWHTARQVGGDFYDIFETADHLLGIVIADVSDKGLAASLYMTVTRTLLRAAALESLSTAQTLERVNDLLLMNSQNGLFVTVFYGILNPQTGELAYTNAGHNPPCLIRAENSTIETLKKGGIALGAMEDIKEPQSTIQMADGDCLIMYTDGVTEAFNKTGQMYGEKRLLKVLHSVCRLDAKSALDAIETDLDKFRGDHPLSDDTTLLAVSKSLLTNQ